VGFTSLGVGIAEPTGGQPGLHDQDNTAVRGAAVSDESTARSPNRSLLVPTFGRCSPQCVFRMLVVHRAIYATQIEEKK
jgi:hypothetical protein